MDKKVLDEFNKYVKTFDLKVKPILNKFHHTYRVSNYAKEIAISLNLKEDEIYIAELCGMLHDIARFSQYTKYKTYVDSNSFDHGDEGVRILLENNFIDKFATDEKIKNIVLCSVRNHNKKYIEKDLSDYEKLFCNIVRDADKIDIMIELCNEITDGSNNLNDEIIDNLKNNKLCDNKLVNNHCDRVLRQLSFIFDVNFKYTFELIKNKKLIENKLHLLSVYTNDIRINDLEKKLKKYVEEMILC